MLGLLNRLLPREVQALLLLRAREVVPPPLRHLAVPPPRHQAVDLVLLSMASAEELDGQVLLAVHRVLHASS